MDKDKKKFNWYVFLSTFARNLIEVFIPMILYKNGYNLKEVIFYFFLVNFFSLIIAYPCLIIAKKFSYKLLSFIGIFSFSIMQILLNTINYSVFYLILIAFMFALYRRGYWISRRFYNLNVISEKNISISYTIICIVNQLAIIFSSYIGSLLLDYVSITLLTIISITLFVISIIPLFSIKIQNTKLEKSMDLLKTLKEISFNHLYLFGTYELINVIKFLFTLYLAIYVKNTYQTVGLLNLLSNLAIMFFTYIFGKKINENKNYLYISIILVVITYLLKVNITSYLLIIISLLEGFFTKMYEVSINTEFYTLSKKFEYEKYNFAYECTQNFTRTLVLFILMLFNNLKIMIYIVLVFILLGTLFTSKKANSQNN